MSRKLLLNNVKLEPDKFFWIGILPYNESEAGGWSDFDKDILNFNEDFLKVVLDAEMMVEFAEEEVPGSLAISLNEADYFIAITPENYVIMIDNGNGTPTPFTDGNGEYPINAEPVKELIGGVQYYMYGFMSLMSGDRTIYVFAD
jgi:hypothetical protein